MCQLSCVMTPLCSTHSTFHRTWLYCTILHRSRVQWSPHGGYGVQLTGVHLCERTWVNGNPFIGSRQYFSPAAPSILSIATKSILSNARHPSGLSQHGDHAAHCWSFEIANLVIIATFWISIIKWHSMRYLIPKVLKLLWNDKSVLKNVEMHFD